MLRGALAITAWLFASAAYAQDVDITRQRVTLRPDFESQQISGRQTIDVRVPAGASELVLSANAYVIDRARLNRRAVTAQRRDNVLVFPLQPANRARRMRLELTFHGAPARGVTWNGRNIHTSYFACDWMFCAQDAPGDKAPIEITLELPPGVQSLANGERRRLSRSGELEAHAWRQPRPYSAYLYGFAAGRMQLTTQRADAVALSVWTIGEAAPHAAATIDVTPAMLTFFEQRAGVPLPGGHYAQLIVPGGEAQEAAGFAVLGANTVGPMLATPQEDWAIAHELAHQWWGNLITCASWRDLWLNEGVTTFMVAAWKEQRWGRAAYDHELDLARTRLAAAREAGFDMPLTFEGAYPSLRVRRAVQYSKGALFMDALRSDLGEEAFWSALRAYTREFAGGTVVTQDFQRVFERESGRDLSALFAAWAY